jgi:hypothetical protein
MTNSVQSAREDLAFLKGVTEDKGPLPAVFGEHLMAAGAIFGANLVLIWAARLNLMDLPREWMNFLWLPGALAYAPTLLFFARRSRGLAAGPAARLFATVWGMAGAMAVSALAVLAIAASQFGASVLLLWPALAFVCYGGAWGVIAIVRRKSWMGAVALASFATAAGLAAIARSPYVWLAEAIAIFLLLAGAGAMIAYTSRETS